MLTCFSARRSARLLPSRNQNELREKKSIRQVEKKRAENGRGPFEKLPELWLPNARGATDFFDMIQFFFNSHSDYSVKGKRFSFVCEYFDTIRYYFDTFINRSLSCILWSQFIIFCTICALAAGEQRLPRNPPDLDLQTIRNEWIYIYNSNILIFAKSLF